MKENKLALTYQNRRRMINQTALASLPTMPKTNLKLSLNLAHLTQSKLKNATIFCANHICLKTYFNMAQMRVKVQTIKWA